MSPATLTDQLRSTLGRLEAALSSVEDALVLTNFNGVVEWTNRSFDSLVARPRLQSLGRDLPDLLPVHYVSGRPIKPHQLIAKAANGGGSELWDLTPDRPRRVLDVSWSPVNLLPKPSLVFVFRDLSSITQAQDQLKQARDTLEQEVSSRTAELLQARDEAVAAHGAMGRFLSSISHEIRTPMNAVIGLTDLLLTTHLDEYQNELIQTIHRSGELLLSLINDILDLSKIEADQLLLNQERLSIHSLVQDCCAMLKPTADSKGLTLELTIEPQTPKVLIGDNLRVRQVLLNLINNAVKFTQTGFVRVHVASTPLEGTRERLDFRIADSGPGIEADFLPRLFDAYSQSPSTSGHSQSTGLGLSICHRLCSLMGGNLEVSSQVGEGSVFSVQLPLQRVRPSHTPNPAAAPLAIACPLLPPRILVAEDNRINQRVLELLLGQLNLAAEFVDDGEAALQRLQMEEFDFVLMDLQMPGIDGLEATRLLRLLPQRQPYVVALTAFAFDQQQRDCREAGMDDFLSKPVRRPDLEAALDRYNQWRQAAPQMPDGVTKVPSRPPHQQ